MFLRSLTVGFLLLPSVSAAKNLCPAPTGKPDPLDISETQLTGERYAQAMDFLNKGVAEALKSHKSIADLNENIHFWIQHANSLRAVEGYVLRQRAIHEGGASVTKFCDFLAKSHWSD